jgi:PKD repeat protein/photosystem II stability/assembly factor-like uncharacterized protein
MKKFFITGIIIFLSFSALLSYGQRSDAEYRQFPYWVEMRQDPETNFYETQKAFELYWEDREVTKGSGWKQFKRWEYFWSKRIDEEGNLPAADKNWNAYQNYYSTRSRSSNGDWINLGPIEQPGNIGTGQPNGNGRLNAIAFHPDNENVIFAGSPSGGLWQTEDGGENWISYTDDLPTLGVSAIAVDYENPDILYIGTGDRDAGDALGIGIMKSFDGGENWELFNSNMGNATVGRLLIDPDDPETLLAATSYGIYKTEDGAVNWTQMQSGNFKDLVFHPGNADIVYATSSGNFYRSEDRGETWNEITSGLPGGSRGAIAVTPGEPDYVYFVLTNQSEYKGMYFSDNAGLSFTEQSTSPNIMTWDCSGNGSGGQAWYDLAIAVEPGNPDAVLVGGVNIFKSADRGQTWNINAHWVGDCGAPTVHADHHVFEVNPINNRLYSGNDGGLHWTDNGGNTWTEITSGLAISQVYKMGQSATVKDYVINGYQDNGSAVYQGDGWTTVLGGDGMDCLIDYSDETYSYGEYYYGNIIRMQNNIYEGGITGGISQEGAWVTPYILHEEDPNTMFVGMNDVWRTNNVKANFTNSIQWQNISDGIGGGKCDVLENSPANTNILYVGKSSQLYRSANAMDEEVVFANLSTNVPGSGSIKDIEAHPYDENIVYLTKGDKVYRSFDKGQSWEDFSGTLPEVSMNTIEYYESSQGGVYAGSDVGIYYRDDSMDDWIDFSNGFPATATVTDLEFYYEPENPAEDIIRVSTYGRGLWESEPYFGTPVADFEAYNTTIPTDCSVDFQDKSLGVPHEWDWEFEGAIPPTSTDKNPQNITYHEEGTYAVTLTVSNPEGEDTQTYSDFISVSGSLLPEAGFTASATSFCSGEEAVVHFYDTSAYCPAQWEWIIEPGSYEFIEGTGQNSQNPVVQFNEDGLYDVSLVATNTAGNNTVTKEELVSVGGMLPPFAESFDDTETFNDWEIWNPDNRKTWESFDIEGNTAMRVNHRDYYVIPGDRDQLVSPTLDFSEMDVVYLHFKHAYSRYYTSMTDSLIVYITDDCGETWNRIFEGGEDGSGNFATAPQATEDFVPENTAEWCGEGYGSPCNHIDISAYAGKKDVKVMFETYNYYNNNIYVDDVIVNNSLATNISTHESDGITIALRPNPAKERAAVVLTGVEGKVVIALYNSEGRKLLSKKTAATSGNVTAQLNLQHLPEGVYLVRVTGNTLNKSKKLIIKR